MEPWAESSYIISDGHKKEEKKRERTQQRGEDTNMKPGEEAFLLTVEPRAEAMDANPRRDAKKPRTLRCSIKVRHRLALRRGRSVCAFILEECATLRLYAHKLLRLQGERSTLFSTEFSGPTCGCMKAAAPYRGKHNEPHKCGIFKWRFNLRAFHLFPP